MGYLTKDEILSVDDLEQADVDCPEWGNGAKVRVRQLSSGEKSRIDALWYNTMDGEGNVKTIPEDYDAKVAVLGCIDENGDQLFTDKDIAGLSKKSPDPLKRIAQAINALSGIEEDDIEEAGNG